MFNRSTDQRVRQLARLLARRLSERWSPDLLADAQYNLSFGQFDGFVSNIAAIVYEGKGQFERVDTVLFDRLVAMLRMRAELEDLRTYIAEHPKRPEEPTHKIWA